jgi:hypothetical protein
VHALVAAGGTIGRCRSPASEDLEAAAAGLVGSGADSGAAEDAEESCASGSGGELEDPVRKKVVRKNVRKKFVKSS